MVLSDKYYGELQGLHRQLNFSIAGKASLDQLQAALDSLEEAMNKGKTFREWQKDVRVQDLGLPKYRLDNIFRTNIQAAYNHGHWEKFVEHQKTRPYLMYDAINDSRVRPSHLAMDGIIRPVGDIFWTAHYPPNGYRCRCRCISLSERQAQDRSKNGMGLNKQVTQEMNPDKGWDYNVGQDLTAGIDKAIAESKANPVLKSVLEKQLAEKIPIVNKEEFANFVEKVTAENYKARHEFVRVGTLPDFVMADSDVIALEPVSNEIHVSDYQLRHSQRPEKSVPLPVEELKKLPEKLENARWFYDLSHDNLIAVFDVGIDDKLGKSAKIINFKRKKFFGNCIVTTGIIDEFDLNNPNYRELNKTP